ncbi:glycosyltransferase family 4 protein [Sedimenticola hydrogenitrophicus]|uniref:glycosyltransferase family 4 protein n=1 Tax=Sedimenticola hydrogenitrophicus TaxID=2967975 RepID=UPI0021A8C2AD
MAIFLRVYFPLRDDVANTLATNMKIIQLLPELNEGGVERGVVELNREFVKRGHTSIVISNGGRLVPMISAAGGEHITLDVCSKNPLSVPFRSYKLSKLFDQLQPDIIHARSRVPAWLCHFANHNRRFPFITTVHGMNSISRYSRIMTTGDRVICVSEVIKGYLLENYPDLNGEKLHVIQRGVDMQLFDPEAVDREVVDEFRRQLGLIDAFIVGSVGRITYLKDYETFIAAIAQCTESIPNIRGVIVGGVRADKQEYLAGLKQLATSLGVAERIVFAGSQSRMPEIYNLFDVMVNASLKMGNVGRTVTEGLAMNTPVIATTFAGLRNLVVDNVNGYIINNQDVDGLAKSIEKLYRTPIRSTRSTVDPEFTLDAMVEKTLTIYGQVL